MMHPSVPDRSTPPKRTRTAKTGFSVIEVVIVLMILVIMAATIGISLSAIT